MKKVFVTFTITLRGSALFRYEVTDEEKMKKFDDCKSTYPDLNITVDSLFIPIKNITSISTVVEKEEDIKTMKKEYKEKNYIRCNIVEQAAELFDEMEDEDLDDDEDDDIEDKEDNDFDDDDEDSDEDDDESDDEDDDDVDLDSDEDFDSDEDDDESDDDDSDDDDSEDDDDDSQEALDVQKAYEQYKDGKMSFKELMLEIPSERLEYDFGKLRGFRLGGIVITFTDEEIKEWNEAVAKATK